MILIFGGAHQGKGAYAKEHFGGKKIISGAERLVLSWLKAEYDMDARFREFMAENADAVIICDDITCGVVPTDPLMRRWRDEVGRFLGLLGRHSNQVIRLYCGIAARLK